MSQHESTLSLIVAFCCYLTDERHFSPNTARCYGADLRQLTEWVARGEEITDEADVFAWLEKGRAGKCTDQSLTLLLVDADVEQLNRYRTFLAEENYMPTTIARKVATLRSFYKWLHKCGFRADNPMTLIRPPRQAKRTPRIASAEQIATLLGVPDDRTLLGARDAAILQLLYATGITVSELCALSLTDLHLEARAPYLEIQRQGKAKRKLPLSAAAVSTLRSYIGKVEADPGFRQAWSSEQSSSPLLLNMHGGRLSAHSIRRKFDRDLRSVGLDPRISPQTLRHSFAVRQLEAGETLSRVSELLGHQSVSTTKGYAPLLRERRANARRCPLQAPLRGPSMERRTANSNSSYPPRVLTTRLRSANTETASEP